MLTFEGFPDINRGLRRYLVHAETVVGTGTGLLTQDTYDRLLKLADSPSPVDTTVNIAELLYARRNQLDSEGRNFAYGLISFAFQSGFHGLQIDNRGSRIAQSLARDEGEAAPAGSSWPEPETDPPAVATMLATAAEPAPPPSPVVEQPPASDAEVEANAAPGDSGNNGPPPPPPPGA